MGGVEIWLLELMKLWAKSGHKVRTDLLLTGGEPDLLDDAARSLGVTPGWYDGTTEPMSLEARRASKSPTRWAGA